MNDGASTAFVGIGSNLEEPLANCFRALHKLQEKHMDVVRCSSFYRTQAVGYEKQPHFVNAVAQVRTPLSPEDLLDELQGIETELGKDTPFKWGPRTIDLDLLLYDDRIINDVHLQVPHPLMHERKFVLTPLAEIAPEVEHPLFKENIADLLKETPDQNACIRLLVDNPWLSVR